MLARSVCLCLTLIMLVVGCQASSQHQVLQAGETPHLSPPDAALLTVDAPTSTAQFTPTPALTLTSLLVTATPTTVISTTPTPLACLAQGGRYEQGSLRDPRLKLPMEYSIYLPPCYDQQPLARFPLLVLVHGMNYHHDQWDRLGADEAADRLIAAGEAPPFLILLPRDRSWAQPSEDPFGAVLVEKLVPYVDENYRTRQERAYRAIGGLSRGAGWAVHLGLSHWELFGAIGGHSPPIFWEDTSKVRGWLDAIPQAQLPRIYLDIGEKDRPSILESARWFENLLTEKGIPHEWYLFPGYHEEAYWSAHVEQYLRWYSSTWRHTP